MTKRPMRFESLEGGACQAPSLTLWLGLSHCREAGVTFRLRATLPEASPALSVFQPVPEAGAG